MTGALIREKETKSDKKSFWEMVGLFVTNIGEESVGRTKYLYSVALR